MSEEPYDTSWDDDDGDIEAYERKYKEWESRDWIPWLKEKLRFPFQTDRMEDDLDPFAPEELHRQNPFSVGCQVDVLRIADEDCDEDFEGIIMEVRGKKRNGCIPLQDIEVHPKSDPNYWPVREFVVWSANR